MCLCFVGGLLARSRLTSIVLFVFAVVCVCVFALVLMLALYLDTDTVCSILVIDAGTVVSVLYLDTGTTSSYCSHSLHPHSPYWCGSVVPVLLLVLLYIPPSFATFLPIHTLPHPTLQNLARGVYFPSTLGLLPSNSEGTHCWARSNMRALVRVRVCASVSAVSVHGVSSAS